MSLRVGALAAGAVLVFGAGVYLFHAVNEAPSHVDAPTPSGRAIATAPTPAPANDSPPPPASNDPAPPQHPGRGTHAHMPSMRNNPPPPPPSDVPQDDPRPGSDDPRLVHPKADSLMDQANKAYDNGDYDDAAAIAQKVLDTDATNVRMMRIMVSSACQSGDNPTAQKYYAQLPAPDREQMKTRCARFGMTFE